MKDDMHIALLLIVATFLTYCNCCMTEALEVARCRFHGALAPALTVSDHALRTAQEYFSEMLRSASPLAYTQHPLHAQEEPFG